MLAESRELGRCQGVGVVVPGMVEADTGKVLRAPNLAWRDFSLRNALAKALGLPVLIENAGKACALAQVWATRGAQAPTNFVYISVSDGLGVGIVLGGEVVRGQHNIAGEFGHVPLNVDGPRCGCGASGCWEAYVSIATVTVTGGKSASSVLIAAPRSASHRASSWGDARRSTLSCRPDGISASAWALS